MKTTEEYLDDYFDKYNELKCRNELWRIRVTVEEFLNEIERIKEYGIDQRKSNYLTSYHSGANQKAMVSVLLMDRVTLEEFISQCERLKEESKYYYD